MLNKKLILGAIGGLLVLSTTSVYAAQTDEVIAREPSEGPRGGDRVHTGTHKLGADEAQFIIAREASEGPRGEGKGLRNSADETSMILAREASEGPRGGDNERPGDRQHRGGRNA
jgi:hypothetical protein